MRMLKLCGSLACLVLFAVLAGCGSSASPDAAANALKPYTADLEKLLADTRAILTPLAQRPEVQGNDVTDCVVVMVTAYHNNPKYTAFGAAKPDGTLWCLTTPQTTPASVADRAYFVRATQTKDFSVGEYQLGRATNKKSIGVGAPILDASGNPQGVVLSPIDLDWLNPELATLPLPDGAEVVLLDGKGILLAHVPAMPELIGTPVGDTPLGKAMLSQIDGSGQFAGIDRVTRTYKFTAPQGSNKNLIIALGMK